MRSAYCAAHVYNGKTNYFLIHTLKKKRKIRQQPCSRIHNHFVPHMTCNLWRSLQSSWYMFLIFAAIKPSKKRWKKKVIVTLCTIFCYIGIIQKDGCFDFTRFGMSLSNFMSMNTLKLNHQYSLEMYNSTIIVLQFILRLFFWSSRIQTEWTAHLNNEIVKRR